MDCGDCGGEEVCFLFMYGKHVTIAKPSFIIVSLGPSCAGRNLLTAYPARLNKMEPNRNRTATDSPLPLGVAYVIDPGSHTSIADLIHGGVQASSEMRIFRYKHQLAEPSATRRAVWNSVVHV
jgi:hypothetical protein